MKKIPFFLAVVLFLSTVCLAERAQPNFIVIFVDDQGYQDLGCFGSPKIKTPNIDQMADEGLKLTSFYVAAPVCSASRSSLLTGRYPARHGVGGAFFPAKGGLNPDEVTIAEVLKTAGYQSACFGKWHLGDEDQFLPGVQGFDEYWGIPYSNDMYIGPNLKFGEEVNWRKGYNLEKAQRDQELVRETQRNNPPWKGFKEIGLKDFVPIMQNDKIVEYPADQSTLTKRYFEHAIDFVDRNKENPFFLYITPSMPHVPLFASDAFRGKSERGLYGDTIEEIDHHVGQLLKHLKETGLAQNTLVIYTSDNGPWLEYGDQGGSADPLRAGKFTNYEGGVREPAVMWWPKTIPSKSESAAIVSTIDFLPTFAELAGAELPRGVTLDGVDQADFLKAPSSDSSRTEFYFCSRDDSPVAYGVRDGDWKYLRNGGKNRELGPELYYLSTDLSESHNLAAKRPDVVKRLDALVASFH